MASQYDAATLENAVAKQSDDEVKTDLELTCTKCGERLCDVEAGDTLSVLADVAAEHVCRKDRRVADITGTIMLANGSTSQFSIGRDFGWQQWGAEGDRIGMTVDVVEAMVAGLRDAEIPVTSDNDEED